MSTRTCRAVRQPGGSPAEKTKGPLLRAFPTAAGLGLEPRLPDPESGVLPLDDPAGRRHCSRASSEVELVERHEPLLRLRVDVRDHLDIRLESGAAQLRLQEAVD